MKMNRYKKSTSFRSARNSCERIDKIL